MAKPDNRSNNVERIQESIDHTIENHHEAKDYLAAHQDELPENQADRIRAKNARRREAVDGFRDEIQDETARRRR